MREYAHLNFILGMKLIVPFDLGVSKRVNYVLEMPFLWLLLRFGQENHMTILISVFPSKLF